MPPAQGVLSVRGRFGPSVLGLWVCRVRGRLVTLELSLHSSQLSVHDPSSSDLGISVGSSWE